MKRRSYALGICWLLVTGFVWVAGLGAAEDETPFERARREIQDAIERERIPSLAVAVARGDQFLWEEGFGWADREQQIKATPHTPYSIASISKPITATALMMLVEQGLIDLDQPANKYLGDAKLVAHAGDAQDATIRRLANHTAGLPLHYQFFYADEARRVPPFEESIRRYGHLLAPPGEEYQYANFGYGVLDQIVQRVSKRSYAEFLEQELFRPLGMQHTAVGIRTDWSPAAAIRYSGGSPLPFYDFDHPGASAVFSSAHDLVRFGLFHLGLRPEDKAKPPARDLLSSESRAEMRRGTADCGGGRRYGVGWFVDPNEFGYETVSHTGGMGGVRCRLVLVPDQKIVVATLCNTSSDVPLEISREVLAALLPDYGERWRTSSQHRPGGDPPAPYAPPQLVGMWQGHVETYAGARRLELWASPDGDVKVRFAGQLVTLLNQSSLKDGILTGVFAGQLDTDDAGHRPHHLHLRLRLRGETMNGALSALSLPARKAGNALSHWVELKRVSTDPQARSLFNGHNLDGWRVLNQFDFDRHGEVTVSNGEIVLGAGSPATGIAWEGPVPRMNYELSLEAKRISGSDFFCGLTFPVGPDYLTLILGGWGGGVTGLSNLDGQPAVENETTGYEDFQADRYYAVRLRVSPDRVEAWVDGKSIVDVSTKGRKLSIWWEQEPARPLGIATWYTQAALRNLRIVRLPPGNPGVAPQP